MKNALERWSENIPNHETTIKLAEKIKEYDDLNGSLFNVDRHTHLRYLLDMIFEESGETNSEEINNQNHRYFLVSFIDGKGTDIIYGSMNLTYPEFPSLKMMAFDIKQLVENSVDPIITNIFEFSCKKDYYNYTA